MAAVLNNNSNNNNNSPNHDRSSASQSDKATINACDDDQICDGTTPGGCCDQSGQSAQNQRHRRHHHRHHRHRNQGHQRRQTATADNNNEPDNNNESTSQAPTSSRLGNTNLPASSSSPSDESMSDPNQSSLPSYDHVINMCSQDDGSMAAVAALRLGQTGSTATQSQQSSTAGAGSQPDPVNVQTRETLRASENRKMIRGLWPKGSGSASSFFAVLFCCLSMYNISRFSVLAYFFKGPFLIQFVILSIGYGLPLLLLLMSLGQYLGTGFYDMWFISPAFKGIGLAFLFTYASTGIYYATPLTWLFTYFRDSLATNRDTTYRWTYCDAKYATTYCLNAVNSSSYEYMGWSVAGYFHGRILNQKSAPRGQEPDVLRVDQTFHLAIIWTLIFIFIGRGLHQAGLILITMGTVSITLLVTISIRFMSDWGSGVSDLFRGTGQPFLTDSMSWLLAAREAFIIWVQFGAIVLNVCGHNQSNRGLVKQVSILAVVVISCLVLSACFFASAVQLIKSYGLLVIPSSYEEASAVRFLRETKHLPMTELRVISGANLIMGENLLTIIDVTSHLSHYQFMRFATEIIPAAVSLATPKVISSVWPVLFYLMAILMTLGPLVVIWGSVVDCVISLKPAKLKLWSSLISFILCVFGFLLGLGLITTNGIYALYFLDCCFGSLWWSAVLYLLLMIAVLIIRGRPCGTDNLVCMLSGKDENMNTWLLPMLTFQWNLIIPVVTLVLAVAFTRSYSSLGLSWTQVVGHYPYWPQWAQILSILIQVLPLLIVFCVAFVQIVVHLLLKPQELSFQARIQSAFCPTLCTRGGTNRQGSNDPTNGASNPAFIDDPPPKYTPPPSYSAATSRPFAQELRSTAQRSRSSSAIDLAFLFGGRRSSRASDTDVTNDSPSGNPSTSHNNAEHRSSSTPPPRYSQIDLDFGILEDEVDGASVATGINTENNTSNTVNKSHATTNKNSIKSNLRPIKVPTPTVPTKAFIQTSSSPSSPHSEYSFSPSSSQDIASSSSSSSSSMYLSCSTPESHSPPTLDVSLSSTSNIMINEQPGAVTASAITLSPATATGAN